METYEEELKIELFIALGYRVILTSNIYTNTRLVNDALAVV